MAPHPILLSSSSVLVLKKSLKILFYSVIHASSLKGKEGVMFSFTLTSAIGNNHAQMQSASSFMLLTEAVCKLYIYRETCYSPDLTSVFEMVFILVRHAASDHQGPLLDQEQSVEALSMYIEMQETLSLMPLITLQLKTIKQFPLLLL